MQSIPFHPTIKAWFQGRYQEPTQAQAQAWPLIAGGENVLVSAPTGSGKTLTAFLFALNQLMTGAWGQGRTRVLYISPLKALNTDISRNLLEPLSSLEKAFAGAGGPCHTPRVSVRSGDTPQSERRRMLSHPPEILITTPESINLMLSSPKGRLLLNGLKCVILDEIHSIIESKRGTHLITAVERLSLLSGEFQRLALSATVTPLKAVAEFVGGYRLTGDPQNPSYELRPVSVVKTGKAKQYDFNIRSLPPAHTEHPGKTLWDEMAGEFTDIIGKSRSSLLFTNSRRLCEKLVFKINQAANQPLAYAHHGSLSKELRQEVEKRLKQGKLKSIVATNSLELGIDIGSLDQVILVQSPPSVSSAIQRIGRAGHRVDQVSRALFFPSHPQDLLEAAVLVRAVAAGDIERVDPVEAALDVLAQVIISMTGTEIWELDELFNVIRCARPYRDLGRREFDLVVEMLAGRYQGARIRELKPKISIDRLKGTARASKGALLSLYMNGGTIPDRGYFKLKRQEGGGLIGELDEEFVWEAKAGQHFTLGAQNWRIQKITHNDVFVTPSHTGRLASPFWIGEDLNRDHHFSELLGLFLEEADQRLNEPDFGPELARRCHMNDHAVTNLLSFLKQQKEHTRAPLPHRRHILAEYIESGPGGVPGHQIILHTFWGGRVNRPFALALSAAWVRRYGEKIECYPANDCISLMLPREIEAEELLGLVASADLSGLLRESLEGSGYFGARFRECAGRALLVGRKRMGRRMPLWMTRMRSKKLMNAVKAYNDFPLLLETWRTCLKDHFDLDALGRLIDELNSGEILYTACHTRTPSPMARSIAWRQTNQYMYQRDDPDSGAPSRLDDDFFKELIFNQSIRPRVDEDLCLEFAAKRQRLSPGYAPDSVPDLVDWLKERLFMPLNEWGDLLAAMYKQHGLEPGEVESAAKGEMAWFRVDEKGPILAASAEEAPRLAGVFAQNGGGAAWAPWPAGGEPDWRISSFSPVDSESRDQDITLIMSQWLSYYGPVGQGFISTSLGLSKEWLDPLLESLIDAERLVAGQLVRDQNLEHLCDAENFEILLRMARRAATQAVNPLPLKKLQTFLASHQGLLDESADADTLGRRLEQLSLYFAPLGLWEAEILPARIKPYQTAELDKLLADSSLLWLGGEKRLATWCYEPERELLCGENDRADTAAEADDGACDHSARNLNGLFKDQAGRYDFESLLANSGKTPAELSKALWEAVWLGLVTSDSFTPARKGIVSGFGEKKSSAKGSVHARANRSFMRRRLSRAASNDNLPGVWRKLKKPRLQSGLIEGEERNKDRVRILLDRYGIVFRQLLMREAKPFTWPVLFRTLRIMELSGEVVGGQFFEGVPSLQFMAAHALPRLASQADRDQVYWFNACDPASLCGLGLQGLWPHLPKRLASNYICFLGTQPALISERNGFRLNILLEPDHPKLGDCLAPLNHLLQRMVNPLPSIKISSINSLSARKSPYLETLSQYFDVQKGPADVVLYPPGK